MKHILKVENVLTYESDNVPYIVMDTSNRIKQEPCIIIATDETNPVLMQCARDNGWVKPNATKMTSANAKKVTSLNE